VEARELEQYEEMVPVPRAALELPVPLPIPPGFDPGRLETWPRVDGRLEYVAGRLWFMPPSGDRQQDTSADVIGVLTAWRKQHRGFKVAGNEAGMLLGGETRAADAAVWRRDDLGDYEGGVRRVAPVLAVEVSGKYDSEQALRDKAGWYLRHGSEVAWLLFPADRRVLVLTPASEVTLLTGTCIPPHDALPDLEPAVDELFEQLGDG
jgi:Uma2 family endonuclease